MLMEQIFEAVEAIRIKKCKPNCETIADYCTRKFGVQFGDVFTELENIVDQGGLLKVEYEGSISYRSPGQFDSNSSPLLTKRSKILNSSRTSRLVITAVSQLLNENQEWNTDGISQKDLETKLATFDAERFNPAQVQTIIDREIAAGNLALSKKTSRIFPMDLFPKDDDTTVEGPATGRRGGRSSGGAATKRGTWAATAGETEAEPGTSRSNVVQDEEQRQDVAEKLTAAVRKTYGFAKTTANASTSGQTALTSPGNGNASDSSARTPWNARATATGGRQSARNKRKKEVFDPNDPSPPKLRTRHGSAGTVCKVCQKQVEKLTKGEEDTIVSCKVCTGQYHSACVPEARAPPIPTPPIPVGGRRSTRRSATATPVTPTPAPPFVWTCPSCKECVICGGHSNKATGEEDLVETGCTNPKCDSVLTLHQGCIAGAKADARKCTSCGVGLLGLEEAGKLEEKESATATEKKGATPGGKRARGRTTAAKKNPATKKAKASTPTPTPEPEPEPNANACDGEAEIKDQPLAMGTTEEIKSEPEKVDEVPKAASEELTVNAVPVAVSTSTAESQVSQGQEDIQLLAMGTTEEIKSEPEKVDEVPKAASEELTVNAVPVAVSTSTAESQVSQGQEDIQLLAMGTTEEIKSEPEKVGEVPKAASEEPTVNAVPVAVSTFTSESQVSQGQEDIQPLAMDTEEIKSEPEKVDEVPKAASEELTVNAVPVAVSTSTSESQVSQGQEDIQPLAMDTEEIKSEPEKVDEIPKAASEELTVNAVAVAVTTSTSESQVSQGQEDIQPLAMDTEEIKSEPEKVDEVPKAASEELTVNAVPVAVSTSTAESQVSQGQEDIQLLAMGTTEEIKSEPEKVDEVPKAASEEPTVNAVPVAVSTSTAESQVSQGQEDIQPLAMDTTEEIKPEPEKVDEVPKAASEELTVNAVPVAVSTSTAESQVSQGQEDIQLLAMGTTEEIKSEPEKVDEVPKAASEEPTVNAVPVAVSTSTAESQVSQGQEDIQPLAMDTTEEIKPEPEKVDEVPKAASEEPTVNAVPVAVCTSTAESQVSQGQVDTQPLDSEPFETMTATAEENGVGVSELSKDVKPEVDPNTNSVPAPEAHEVHNTSIESGGGDEDGHVDMVEVLTIGPAPAVGDSDGNGGIHEHDPEPQPEPQPPKQEEEEKVATETMLQGLQQQKQESSNGDGVATAVDEKEVPEVVPDLTKVSGWSPREVEAFFHSKGLIEEGTVFHDEEVDGVALLLMRKEDIALGLKFRLGPAIKIYRLILELQKLPYFDQL